MSNELSALDQQLETLTGVSMSASKAESLSGKKEQKLQALGTQSPYTNFSNTYTTTPEGYVESNRNKIWNELDASQRQQLLSDAAHKQVFQREDGSMYQITPEGQEVSFEGDTRRAYMYGTKESPDTIKFGLARGDLPSSDYRYVPGLAEAEGYDVGQKGYGWDPGSQGVDVSKNYMDMLLPYDTATALEGVLHGNKEALQERAYKDTAVVDPTQIGSGVSEYYTSPEGLLGNTQNVTTLNKASLERYEALVPRSEQQESKPQKKSLDELLDQDNYLQESVDAAQSSMIKWWGQAQKAVGKVAQSAAEAVGMSKEEAKEFKDNYFAASGLFSGETFDNLAKQEVADRIAGVRTETRQEFQQAQQAGIKALEEGKYGEAVWGIVTNLPMFLADSFGEMLSLVTLPTTALTIAGRTSEQAEKYEENNGKEPSSAWITGSVIAEAMLLLGERFIIGKGVKDVLEKGSNVAQKAKKLGTTMGFEAVQEAGETTKEEAFTQKGAFTPEAEQTLGEIVTSPETQYAALAAALSAGALQTTGDVVASGGKVLEVAKEKADVLKSRLDDAKENLTVDTEAEKEVKVKEQQAAKVEEDIINSIKTSAAKNDTATAISKVKEAIEYYNTLDSNTRTAKMEELKPVAIAVYKQEKERHQKIAKTGKIDATTLRAIPEREEAILEAFMDLDTQEEVDSFSEVLSNSPTLKEVLGAELPKRIQAAKEDRNAILAVQEEMNAVSDLQAKGFKSQKDIRTEVIKSGMAIDKLGALEWFKLARSKDPETSERGKANIRRFQISEEQKANALSEARDGYSAEIKGALDQRLIDTNKRAVAKGIAPMTEEEMLKAQLYMEASPIKELTPKEKKDTGIFAAYEKLAAIDGFKVWDKASGKDFKDYHKDYTFENEKRKAYYTTSTAGKHDGVFEMNTYETLLDVTKNTLPELYSKLGKESSITNLINAINREVNVMDTMLNIVDKPITEKEITTESKKEVDETPVKEPTKEKEIEKPAKVEKISFTDFNEGFAALGAGTTFRSYLIENVGTISFDPKDYKNKKAFIESMFTISRTIGDKTKKPDEVAIRNKARKALLEEKTTRETTAKESSEKLTLVQKQIKILKKGIREVIAEKDILKDTIKSYKNAIASMKADKTLLVAEKKKVIAELDKTEKSIERQKELANNYMKRIDETKEVNTKDIDTFKKYLDTIKKWLDVTKKRAITQVKRFLTRMRNLENKVPELKNRLNELEDRLIQIDEDLGLLYADKNLVQEKVQAKDVKISQAKELITTKKQEEKALKEETQGTLHSLELINDIAYGANKGKVKALGFELDVSLNNLLDVQVRPKSTLASIRIDKLENKKINGIAKLGYRHLGNLVPLAGSGKTGKPGLVTDVGRGLLLNKEGTNYNPNVVMAMMSAIAEEASIGASKYNMLSQEEVERYYGLSEGEGNINVLSTLGVPKKYIANTLGKAIINNLGMKMKKGADEFVYEKLTQSLGQTAVFLAEKLGYWNINTIPTEELALALGKEPSKTEATSDHILISKEVDTKIAKGIFSTITNELALPENIKNVRFSKRKLDDYDSKIRRNDKTEAPEATKEVVKEYMNTKYELNTDAVEFIMHLNNETKKALLGYEFDVSNKGFRAAKGSVSKNREIERNLEALEEVYTKITEGEESNNLYFDWFIARSGRMMIDSARFNPQAKKLHRSIVNTKEQISEVTKENEHVFKLAIAQAFGFDIDKKAIKDSIKFVDTLISNKNFVKNMTEAIKQGEKSIEVDGVKAQVHELGHTVVALLELEKWQNRDTTKPFTTRLTVEADALTSGFGLKMLQMPLVDNYEEWLQKAGIFVGGKKSIVVDGKEINIANKPMSEILTMIEDSYKTLAKGLGRESEIKNSMMSIFDMGKETLKNENKIGAQILLNKVFKKDKKRASKLFDLLNQHLPKLIEGDKVTKEGRSLFKGPFMTFNYGAGFPKIKQELTYEMQESLIQKMLDGEMDSFIVELVGAEKVSVFKNSLKNRDVSRIKFKGGYTLQELFNALLGESYGNRVQEVLATEFSGIVEANNLINDSFRIMFRIYKKIYDKIADEEYGGRPTIEESVQIFEGLKEAFPIIKAPLGKGKDDGIAIYKDVISSESKLKYGDIQSHLYTDGKGSEVTSKNVQSVLRTLEEAGAAGAVIPIHYLDASIMAKATKGREVLEIHDALNLGVGHAEELVKQYNKDLYELSKDWDFVEEVYKSIDNASKRYGEVYDLVLMEQAGREEKVYDLDKFKAIKDKVNTVRNDIFSNDVIVDHMVFTDTVYEAKKGKPTPPKGGKSKQADLVKKAAEIPIEGSEDIQAEAVKDLFKKSPDKAKEDYYKSLSEEDLVEIDKQFDEDRTNQFNDTIVKYEKDLIASQKWTKESAEKIMKCVRGE